MSTDKSKYQQKLERRRIAVKKLNRLAGRTILTGNPPWPVIEAKAHEIGIKLPD